MIESFCVDFVALVNAVAAARGLGSSTFAAQLDLLRADPERPIVAIDQMRHGGFVGQALEIVTGSRQIRQFHPIVFDTIVPDEPEALLDLARQAATDVLAQFGVGHLNVIPAGPG